MLWFPSTVLFLIFSTSVTLAIPTSDDNLVKGQLLNRDDKCPGGGKPPCICMDNPRVQRKGIRKGKLKCPEDKAVSYTNPEDPHDGNIQVGRVRFYSPLRCECWRSTRFYQTPSNAVSSFVMSSIIVTNHVIYTDQYVSTLITRPDETKMSPPFQYSGIAAR